jgi:hypothetical protein
MPLSNEPTGSQATMAHESGDIAAGVFVSCHVSIRTNCLNAVALSGCISTFEFPMLQQ